MDEIVAGYGLLIVVIMQHFSRNLLNSFLAQRAHFLNEIYAILTVSTSEDFICMKFHIDIFWFIVFTECFFQHHLLRVTCGPGFRSSLLRPKNENRYFTRK